MQWLPLLFAGLAGLMLLIAALCDIRRFEIPDSLSIAILALAVAYGLTQPGFPWLWHGASLLLMFGIGAGLFAIGWMGGGDVKLLVASAAWTTLKGLPMLLAGVMLAGGVLAILLLAGRAVAKRAGAPADSMPGPLREGAPLPYAIAIAGGIFWWAWRTWPL
ncbi:prepilin peptidase [Sandaracinobacter sp. RS1-74]|uniref:A24 family peptidase n=1 Tax=Sandaracinobacteroides sayramensis TaxID=2913411 RepID=UPI001EDC3F99|nr:prepilin peptidase [Sandaracinobacteroides sayramensis]MCG2840565.1 prepilin peptidase [Sandaracinobacteroides sayramensis]